LRELKTKLSIKVNDDDVGTNVDNQDNYVRILDPPPVKYNFYKSKRNSCCLIKQDINQTGMTAVLESANKKRRL